MNLNWQQVYLFKVEACPQGLWTTVSDYMPGSRLLRFTVVDKDAKKQNVDTKWCPAEGTNCGPDGTVTTPAKSSLLFTGAMYGALIGKLGGSSADVPDGSSLTAPYGSKRVFAVGSHCVISLNAGEGGPLYLTLNDSPDGFPHHSGALHVLIEEYAT